jgi:hypothetical protein
VAELVVGTLKLEGTDEAVTREQAAELLPLWQVYQDLITSDTAAQAEIDGLTKQIQEAMTDSQLESINAMKLTQADVMAVMQAQGSAVASVPRGDANTDQGNNAFPGGGFAGGMPSGGPGGMPDGGFMPGGIVVGGTQGAGTPQAEGQQPRGRGTGGVPAPLLNALVEYLEKKAAS